MSHPSLHPPHESIPKTTRSPRPSAEINDASAEATARNYGARLSRMVGDPRMELGSEQLPFVAGKLGELLTDRTKEGQEVHWRTINLQLDELVGKPPRFAVVESRGLSENGDGVHFDTRSLREFGRRYAAALKRILAK